MGGGTDVGCDAGWILDHLDGWRDVCFLTASGCGVKTTKSLAEKLTPVFSKIENV
jgi:hypothetical protein